MAMEWHNHCISSVRHMEVPQGLPYLNQGDPHMAKSKIQPLADRILVKRLDDEEEQKVGGIIIPDTAKEKPQEAEVVAIGPGRLEDGERVAPEVKKGDRVLIGKYSGTEVKLDGEEHLILREEEILAVIS